MIVIDESSNYWSFLERKYMKNIMIDIETLDTHPGGVILSIAAVSFGIFGVHTTKYYQNIDVLSSVMAGFTVDPKTVAWWNKQDLTTFNIFKGKTTPIRNALAHLSEFIRKDDQVWAKGPDFDLVLLSHAYDKLGMRVPWSFRNARDVRTMLWMGKALGINLEEGMKPVPFTKHFALDDAIYQANQVAALVRKVKIPLD